MCLARKGATPTLKKEDQDALVGSRDVCCKHPDMALASEATGAANFGLRRDCGLLKVVGRKKRGSGCLGRFKRV
jgi:hypothetical protein